MSSIEKMSILGIRSFGYTDRDKQIIQFYSPLTLILGPNGTGKTTIIECLKYATTGDMPPNGKGAFIHDPKIAHESEIKGQIKLQINDVKGRKVIVTRSMQATQKAKKIETRTLDSAISFVNGAGEKVSITSRCADTDKEMVSMMGVSKPVLENVIFCHQEDSSWPLSEGKALKQKFDDIFASTRYVKALEVIRKFRLEQNQIVKEYQAEIKYLKQNKEKASEIKSELEEKETQHQASRTSVQLLDDKLNKLNHELTELTAKLNSVFDLKRSIDSANGDLKHLQTSCKELEDGLDEEFDGDQHALEDAIAEFTREKERKESNIGKLRRQQDDISEQLDILAATKSSLLVEQGRLRQKKEACEENIVARDEKVVQLAEVIGSTGFTAPISASRLKDFMSDLKESLLSMAEEGKNAKREFEEKERAAQAELNRVRESRAAIQTTQRAQSDLIVKHEAELKKLSVELRNIDNAEQQMEDIKAQVRQAEQALREAESEEDCKMLEKDIKRLMQERDRLQQIDRRIGTELTRLHQSSGIKAKLDVLKKEHKTKEDTVSRIKSRQKENLDHVLGHSAISDVKNAVTSYLRSKNKEVQAKQKLTQKVRNELSTQEAKHSMLSEDLRKKTRSAADIDEEVFNLCGAQAVDDALSTVTQQLQRLQDEKGAVIGGEVIYKQFVRRLAREDPPCPLCHRQFDQQTEVHELVTELENRVAQAPEKIAEKERDIERMQQKFNDMQQLKPRVSELRKLQDNEIPAIKAKVTAATTEITKLKTQISEREDSIKQLELDISKAQALQPDAALLETAAADAVELERKINSLTAQLPEHDADKSIEQVTTEKEENQIELDRVTRQLDSRRDRLNQVTRRVQDARASLQQIRAKQLTLQSEVQKRQQLRDRQASLRTELSSARSQLDDLEQKLQPLADQIKKLEKEKTSISEEKEKVQNEYREKLNAWKQKGETIKTLQKKIQQYQAAGTDAQLKEIDQQFTQAMNDTEKAEEKRQAIGAQLNRAQQDLAQQQVRWRTLQDNLTLRVKRQEASKLETKLTKLRSQLGDLDVKGMERNRIQMQTQIDSQRQEKSRAEGRMLGFEEEIRRYKRELNSDQFKDADVKYRDKLIDLRTTELANGDLDKYYKALDQAIMKYHTDKMNEINKIIRELWQATYRGNDIETIEIRSEQDEAGGTTKRRTYNYRVVMLRSNAVLDMRGRCSAGQKVLASLIIRLSLAETFCLNCGIMALDEPTTNLDRENIESLASSLVNIIRNRSDQRNFQLVVITHDEDFVELLGRAEYVEYFFKISKDRSGHSLIKKERVEQLHNG